MEAWGRGLPSAEDYSPHGSSFHPRCSQPSIRAVSFAAVEAIRRRGRGAADRGSAQRGDLYRKGLSGAPARPPEALRSSAPPRSVPSVAFIPGEKGEGVGPAEPTLSILRGKTAGKGGREGRRMRQSEAERAIYRSIYIHPQVALMKRAPKARAGRCLALVPAPAALSRFPLPSPLV